MVVIRFLLFLSGDVVLKPGPPLNYTQFSTLMKKHNDQVKFLHQNCQSVLGQRFLLKNFLSDLGDNCILGFGETWLKSVNDVQFWSIHSKYLVSFRCNRRTDLQEKNKGGRILLFVPKKFHPKARNDLGPSLIPAWALKDAREHIAEPLCYLFNQFLTEQRFSDIFNRAHVLPLFKEDDPEDPINYWPTSLTGALAKIFKILLRDQILAYLEKNKLLATTQFGYRKKL